METFPIALAAALAAIGGTALTRVIDLWFAKRHRVGPLVAETDAAKRELIETLEQTAQARADRISTLEDELRDERESRAREVEGLNLRVQRLERALGLCLDRLTEDGKGLPDLD